MHILRSRFAIIIFAVLFQTALFAQNKGVAFMRVYQDGKAIVDLTDTVEKQCTEIKRSTAGNVSIEIRYQPEFTSDANIIFSELEKVVEKTEILLPSLPTKKIYFYLLRTPEPPKSYKIRLKSDFDPFIYAEVLNMTDPLDLSCKDLSDTCHNIYQVLPHELVHPLLENLIEHEKTRWFNDGLAEYVGRQVLRELKPKISFREREIASRSILHLAQKRGIFLDWQDPYLSDISRKSGLSQLFDSQLYDASQQFIRLIIIESEKKGIENPISLLLSQMNKKVKEKKVLLNRKELIALIQNELKVDVRTLGILDADEQKELVRKAIAILSYTEDPSEPQNVYYAVSVLANLDEVPLTDEWVKKLLIMAYSKVPFDYSANMAATALVRRDDRVAVEKAFNELQQTDEYFKKIKFRTVWKYLKQRLIDKNL